MIVINKETGLKVFGSKGKEYIVSDVFWRAIREGRVRYRDGGVEKGDHFTIIIVLDIKSLDFEKALEDILNTAVGKSAAEGKESVDTIL